jgi:ubiquinone/menaquinone biosynthesis C-methylase UbiE
VISDAAAFATRESSTIRSERLHEKGSVMSQTTSFKTYGGTAPENYERYFVPSIGRPLAVNLVMSATPQPGERALDIGCGTGVVARLAREEVAPTGSVAGVDPNPGMLAVAEQLAPEIEWYRAGADGLPLPDTSFDLALSQLSLQFVPDKLAALREAHRVLRPGGRIAVNVPGPTPPLFAIMEEALQRHVGRAAAAFVGGVFSLHETDEIRELFVAAGFSEVVVRTRTPTLSLPAPADFLWQYIHSTPLATPVTELSEDTIAAIEQDVVAGWEPFTRDAGLELAVRIVTTHARR